MINYNRLKENEIFEAGMMELELNSKPLNGIFLRKEGENENVNVVAVHEGKELYCFECSHILKAMGWTPPKT